MRRRLSPRALRAPLLLVLALGGLGAATRDAAAQAPWESPQMLAPASPAGFGLYVVDWGLGPGDGVGLLVAYRGQAAPGGIGLRAGAARGFDDEVIVAGGADFSLPLFQASADFPLDVIWTSGIGAAWGDYGQVGVPIGFAAGRPLGSDAIWFNPYVSARAVFEGYFGQDRPSEDFALSLATDIGADVSFDRARRFIIRLAASLGDRHALVAGVHARL
jgi:hypothetical protein